MASGPLFALPLQSISFRRTLCRCLKDSIGPPCPRSQSGATISSALKSAREPESRQMVLQYSIEERKGGGERLASCLWRQTSPARGAERTMHVLRQCLRPSLCGLAHDLSHTQRKPQGQGASLQMRTHSRMARQTTRLNRGQVAIKALLRKKKATLRVAPQKL